MAFLRAEPLDLARLVDAVTSPERGGISTFLGLVRNQHGGRPVVRLEYSAYAPMVEQECAVIIDEARARWPTAQVALEHRIGALDIGDAAVVVAAAAPHRDEAFAACRYVIEEVKRRVPIWKREYYADGSVGWVDPTAPGGSVPARPEAGQAG
jgi:molybdopterin synthase catalytic subunit